MKRRLFLKYYFGTAVIVILSLGIMLGLLAISFNRHMSAEKHRELQKASDSVARFCSDPGNSIEGDLRRSAYFVMSSNVQMLDCEIYVTDKNGAVTVCSCKEWGENGICEHIGTSFDADVLKSAASGKEEFSTVGVFKAPRYIAATAIKSGGETTGYVLSSASSESIKSLFTDSLKIYALCAVVPLALMFAALYIMTYRMSKPLKLMSEAAHAMARGDFSKRIPVTSDDEIGELAASFNKMTNSLARLEETRKNFVANVSHEMRTPMTTIGGFIDGIIDGTIEPEKQDHYLNIVSQEVKRLSRMIQSMLSLSRLESSEFVLKTADFDLREQILEVVIGQEQRIEEKNIEIAGLDALPSVVVCADKDLIYQAIYNLLDNAIKFVDVGGTVSFTLGVDSAGAKFSITNSGAGIPRADLPYIFDRFYKLDKSRAANKNSMGLGLYIVKTIIKHHGGTVSVSSKENEFTRFEFVLPLGK